MICCAHLLPRHPNEDKHCTADAHDSLSTFQYRTHNHSHFPIPPNPQPLPFSHFLNAGLPVSSIWSSRASPSPPHRRQKRTTSHRPQAPETLLRRVGMKLTLDLNKTPSLSREETCVIRKLWTSSWLYSCTVYCFYICKCMHIYMFGSFRSLIHSLNYVNYSLVE